jgi:hypothetical protein
MSEPEILSSAEAFGVAFGAAVLFIAGAIGVWGKSRNRPQSRVIGEHDRTVIAAENIAAGIERISSHMNTQVDATRELAEQNEKLADAALRIERGINRLVDREVDTGRGGWRR